MVQKLRLYDAKIAQTNLKKKSSTKEQKLNLHITHSAHGDDPM